MDKKILTFRRLSLFFQKCNDWFAKKEIESRIVNIQVSKEMPANQKFGDVWFEETERE